MTLQQGFVYLYPKTVSVGVASLLITVRALRVYIQVRTLGAAAAASRLDFHHCCVSMPLDLRVSL